MSFDASKIAHMSAYFILKSGGNINHMKLLKILYLAERESFRKYGWSMSDDYLVSMPYGPVLSNALNLINRHSHHPEWAKLISRRQDNFLFLNQENTLIDDLEELSPADIKILEKIWSDFGDMGEFQLRDYTHNPQNCPEWKDPQGSMRPIKLETLLESVGYSKEDVEHIIERKTEQDGIDDFIASL